MTNFDGWIRTRLLATLGAASLVFAGCAGDAFQGPASENPNLDPTNNPNDNPVVDDDDMPVALGTALTGVVRDAWGMPLAGVAISTSNGLSTESDANGRFAVDGLDPADGVLVNFALQGYAKTQTPIDILEDVENTILQTMAVVDLVETFESADGISFEIEADGPTVTLPGANFVDADGFEYSGQVTVEATFYDLTSEVDDGLELFATPGDFTAVDAAGVDQRLESWGMFQVNLWGENGEELELGVQAAPVRMPMQIRESMPEGTTVPAWSYNESTGKWVEEAIGTVVYDDALGQYFWEFEAPHFSTWNCDQPLPTHGCVTGQVTNSQGTPRAGATVRAVGITYTSTTTARTGQDGSFCLEVKNGETVWLEISYTVGGQPATQRTDPVTIPSGQGTCTDGNTSDCVDIGVVPIDIMTCVSGVVVDAQGAPVAGARVVSPQGGLADTADDGSFCMSVPVFQSTEVYVLNEQFDTGFQPTRLFTQAALPDCQGGCPNLAILRPYQQTTCAAGEVIINSQAAQSVPVEAFDTAFPDIPVFTTTTEQDGSYCLEVPANTSVTVRVGNEQNPCGSETFNPSTNGATCDDDPYSQGGECTEIPAFTCSL